MALSIFLSVSGLIIGLVIGYLVAHVQETQAKTAIIAQRDVLQSQVDSLRMQLQEAKAAHERDVNMLKEEAVKDLNTMKEEKERQQSELRQQHQQQLQELRQQHQEQLESLRQQQREQLSQQAELIREQINTASEKILKERSEELSSTNKMQLAEILNPLHEHIRQMKEAVEKSDREQTTTMERLDAAIKANLQQAQTVGERADKLAEALTSENKSQGDFGELRLRTLLENMGLEEGVQFEEQTTMKDALGNTIYEEEEGRRMIPDVILHFPENRDVIIDSKMSLKAFEEYFNAEGEELKKQALTRHIASVRSHVKELARKNYNNYIKENHHKLNFVLMYIYSESALQLALANAPGLWKEAYDEGVIITGSRNLFVMLKVLEMSWKQVRQAENQAEIMKTADEIVNRVQRFYERFTAVDEQLSKTQKAFNDLKISTSPTGLSIITAANRLIKYGAQENPKRKMKLPKPADEVSIDDMTTDDLPPTETENLQ